jgi:hypothetical protein
MRRALFTILQSSNQSGLLFSQDALHDATVTRTTVFDARECKCEADGREFTT